MQLNSTNRIGDCEHAGCGGSNGKLYVTRGLRLNLRGHFSAQEAPPKEPTPTTRCCQRSCAVLRGCDEEVKQGTSLYSHAPFTFIFNHFETEIRCRLFIFGRPYPFEHLTSASAVLPPLQITSAFGARATLALPSATPCGVAALAFELCDGERRSMNAWAEACT